MADKIKILIILISVFVLSIEALADPVQVQRLVKSKLPASTQNQKLTKDKTSQKQSYSTGKNITVQNKKGYTLADVKKKCSNYMKYRLSLSKDKYDETENSDYCLLKFQLNAMGAEKVSQLVYLQQIPNSKNNVAKYSNKRCIVLRYKYNNNAQESKLCE